MLARNLVVVRGKGKKEEEITFGVPWEVGIHELEQLFLHGNKELVRYYQLVQCDLDVIAILGWEGDSQLGVWRNVFF